MKKTIILSAFYMLMNASIAQNFNLIKTDSLMFQFKEGFMEIKLQRFTDRYDSSLMEMSARLLSLWPEITQNSDGKIPYEIRYIRNGLTGEFLKTYNEAEEETNDWGIQKLNMVNIRTMRPRGDWRIYLADMDRHISFVLLAHDSNNIKRLLQKNLTGKHAKYAEVLKNTRKTDCYFGYIIDTNRNDALNIFRMQQGIQKISVKSSAGLGFNGNQFLVNLSQEFSYIHYRDLTPKYKLGIATSAYFGKSMFTSESDSASISNLSMIQGKFAWLYSSQKPWFGFKLGLGLSNSAVSTISGLSFISYGLTLENTRLIDFDLDFFLTFGNSRFPYPGTIMLTAKLPF